MRLTVDQCNKPHWYSVSYKLGSIPKTTDMKKTDTASLMKLKNIMKVRWQIDLEIYEDIFSRTDAHFMWNNRDIEVEVKCRRFSSDKYPTTIINSDKYDELLQRNAILVVMFDDCWYLFKNVKEAFCCQSMKYCRSTTDFGGRWAMSPKVELSLSKGIRYDY